MGHELYCGAVGNLLKPVALDTPMTIGGRRVAITTRPICNDCALPDEHIICSHLRHPRVLASHTNKREIQDRYCDLDKDGVGTAELCRMGGHSCAERVVAPESRTVTHIGPLDLLDALDFLAATWRNAFSQRLLKLSGTAQVGTLTQPCQTRDEFKSCLTALVDTMKAMTIPGNLLPDGSKLQQSETLKRMRAALEKRSDERNVSLDERKPALEAVDVLAAVNDARNSFQHSDTFKHVSAWTKLGITYPVSSWANAWLSVRASVIAALRALRRFTATLSDD